MDKQQIIDKLRKFTADPDWSLMEDLIKSHLAPLNDVMNIDSKLTNDQIASEVRGRQLSIAGLTKFLNDAKVLTRAINMNDKVTFR